MTISNIRLSQDLKTITWRTGKRACKFINTCAVTQIAAFDFIFGLSDEDMREHYDTRPPLTTIIYSDQLY